jgi:predicted Zn-dependent protease
MLAHSTPCVAQASSSRRAPQPAEFFQDVPFAPDQFLEKMFGASTPEQVAELAKIKISPAEEKQFGDSIVTAFLADARRQGLKVQDRGRDVEYLRDLVNTIRPYMANNDRYRTIKVYFVDSPEIDARSCPGGTLVFFRGLLEFAGSEAALVGIVGHELSHLDHGHQLAPLRRMRQFEQSIEAQAQGFTPERTMSALSTAIAGYTHPFRPEDESEADRDGAAWAFRAGYDPREMAELFMKLHRRHGDQPAMVLPFLHTHPFHIDRYQAIQKQYAELQLESPNESLYVGRPNLKARIARAKREFEEK